MARKSGWQEFAENFQSTYGIVNKVKQGYDTNQVMNDEKFTAEGKGGAGLSGGALEKARYKALGDIATKYGDTAGGLANRTALADLNAKDRDNTINQSIMKELAYIRGQGAVRNLDAGSSASEASAANSYAGADQKRILTPEMVAKYRADTQDVYTGIAKQNAEIAGLKIDNSSKRRIQPSEDAAKISGFELLKAQNNGDLANIDLRNQANAELFTTSVREAYANQNQAQINELQTLGFLDYSTRFADGEFTTGAEATEAYVNVVAQFDPGKAANLIKNYSENEISQIANQGLEFQATVTGLVQKNDFEGIRAFFDEQNGDATGVTLEVDPETGGIKMFQTSAEGEVIPIMDAPNAAEARAQLESVATYGNAASYAESLFARRKGEAEINKTVALTGQANATAQFTTENTKGLAGGRRYNNAQIGLANVRAREIRAELRQKYTTEGKAELKVQADQKALDKFLTDNLPLLALDPEMDVDALVEQFLTSRQQTAITFDPAD